MFPGIDTKYLERWLQRQDDELVDFVEERPHDNGDIEDMELVNEPVSNEEEYTG